MTGNADPPVIPLADELPLLGLTRSILVVDAETASPVDLKKRGHARYWADSGTRTMMLGYKPLAQNGPPAALCDFEVDGPSAIHPYLDLCIRCPPEECLLAAANVDFDRDAVRQLGYETPHEKWIDVLTCAYILGFSGRLDDVLKQTPLDIAKDPEGTRLITLFSIQQRPWYEEPEKWEKFRGYCLHDATVEEQLLRWMFQWLNTPEFAPMARAILQRQEIRYRKVNARGIPVDRDAVRGALRVRDAAVGAALDRMADITGLDNPNSRDQLLGWLRENGARIADLRKETIRDALDGVYDEIPATAREVLALRQQTAKTSTKKFDALDAVTSDDGYLRYAWRFYAASRTGRVGGRVLNPANLARPSIERPELVADFLALDGSRHERAAPCTPLLFREKKPLELLSSTIRACLKAPEGKQWCVADLSSIESVGAAWLAGCKTIMNVFFAGKDTYTTFAARAEGVPYDAVTKKQRTFYKPAVLGGAYMLSGYSLVQYAAGMGVTLTEEEGRKQIAAFREEYHEIPHYWTQLKQAAIDAVKNPGKTFSAYAVESWANPWGDEITYRYADWPRVDYRFDGTFLICKLPSGRALFYYDPRVDPNHEIHMANGESFTTEALLYWGIDQKATGQFWREISTHGGKLLENCTQAICRDILWVGLELADDDPDLDVLGDVYDELLALCGIDDRSALQRLIAYMTTRPHWFRNTPFYLGASGYLAARYTKD